MDNDAQSLHSPMFAYGRIDRPYDTLVGRVLIRYTELCHLEIIVRRLPFVRLAELSGSLSRIA